MVSKWSFSTSVDMSSSLLMGWLLLELLGQDPKFGDQEPAVRRAEVTHPDELAGVVERRVQSRRWDVARGLAHEHNLRRPALTETGPLPGHPLPLHHHPTTIGELPRRRLRPV